MLSIWELCKALSTVNMVISHEKTGRKTACSPDEDDRKKLLGSSNCRSMFFVERLGDPDGITGGPVGVDLG